MPFIEKQSPVQSIQTSGDYPPDSPKVNDQKQVDKWWFDLRTVLLRDLDTISGLVNRVGALEGTAGFEARLSAVEKALADLDQSPNPPSQPRPLIFDKDVAPAAAIQESKLRLTFPTHNNDNDPSAGEKGALRGTTGTPSPSNPYVTTNDPRLNPSPVGDSMPIGAVLLYAAGAGLPEDWLECDGSSKSRSTYNLLYAAIGTAYGSVDGTHFNLPDFRGRAPIGAGTGSGLTARAVGSQVGAETVMIATTGLPNLEIAKVINPPQEAGTAGQYFPVADQMASGVTSSLDGGDAVDPRNGLAQTGTGIMQPSLTLRFIIKAGPASSGTTVTATDNFNAYANGTFLESQPNWAALGTSSIVIEKPAADGRIRSFIGSQNNVVQRTSPTFSANHRAEITLKPGSGDGAIGVAVRCQTGVFTCYELHWDDAGNNLYLARIIGGQSNWTEITHVAKNYVTGNKIALEVTGTGAATRLTAQEDTGTGWVNVFSSVDPGSYINGGQPGVYGFYGSSGYLQGDDWFATDI